VQGHDHIYRVLECKTKGYTIVWYFILEGIFTCESVEKSIRSNNPWCCV